MYLDERKKRILQAVVQDYIATAEPVGSRTLARKYNLGVSPATIRNEMADLEEMGLLEQPHTSAGRIPSDLGYRYYVDYLMEKTHLTAEEQDFIVQSLATKLQAVEELIARTSEVLSAMTNLTGLALGPQWAGSVILYIELLPLVPEKAILLVVTNMGTIQHRFLEIPDEITARDLAVISEVLTRHLRGLTLERLSRAALRDIRDELAAYRRVVGLVLEAVEDAIGGGRAERIYLGGTLNILNQPEFRRDLAKVKDILNVLETEHLLRQLLLEEAGGTLAIRIGEENRAFNMPYCSIVTASYRVGDRVMGAIGLLGPTRMEYARAVATIEFMSSFLSEMLAHFYR
ncbi:MAG: heat-inducible transcription repressor HrcA [Clostridia bacterium]|nr:heat-inducible transcription repressor HrcA [Clostridia bacterium]